VLSFLVTQATPDIAIRTALGAQRNSIPSLVLPQKSEYLGNVSPDEAESSSPESQGEPRPRGSFKAKWNCLLEGRRAG
jgi:hypothetical protein